MKEILQKLDNDSIRIFNHQYEALELFVTHFVSTLNPPIDELSESVFKKRDIVRCIQGDKTWFTTHGSRASKILEMKIEYKNNVITSKVSII